MANDSTSPAVASGLDQICVRGGYALNGKIRISGAKNAALPLMCAALLTEKTLILSNIPTSLRDIQTLSQLLEAMGCTLESGEQTLSITAKTISDLKAPYDLVRKMRASILVLGPLLARFGEAEVSLPGGCAIGTRPVDLHIDGLKEMGADIVLEEGYIKAHVPNGRLTGTKILFPKVSVGATENLMMAATLAEGTTVLANAAREPEIIDLGECLNAMGARISGLGTEQITIEGVETLNGATHDVVADRIETGTYAIAAAMAGGEILLQNAHLEHIKPLMHVLEQAGVTIEQQGKDILVRRDRMARLRGIDIMTEPYPGFPTDLQAQIMAMLTTCDGAGMVTETIFENRFMHVPELCRMGANITVHGASALIRGVEQLKGAEVMATDLRASVSLILAALVAEGETIINRVYHLDRGYEYIVEKLANCGADIKRVKSQQ